jgi:hypothetical protein
MIRVPCMRYTIAAAFAAMAACSNDTTSSNGNDAQLAIFNALAASGGAQLLLDNTPATLPSVGGSSSMTVAAGTHQLILRSAGGEQLATASFAMVQGARRTAVVSGSTTANAALSIISDTMSTSTGGGYRSIIGSILMVNSAPGVGPFSIVVHQVGSDSVYHFGNFGFGAGSLPPPAPYGFYIPFVPATYIIDITNPGSETSLATTQLTLATDDRWIVMLTTSIEGDLVLQAAKQQ